MSQGNDSTDASGSGSKLSRRRVLAGAGAAAGAAVVGGAALSGSAAASSSFEANQVTVESPDGSVEKVTINPTGTIQWEDYSDEVQHISIRIQSRVRNKDNDQTLDGWKEVYTNTFDLGDNGGHYGNIKNHSLGEIALYDGDNTDVFEADADGSSTTRRVDLQLDIHLLNSDEDLASPTDESDMSDTTAFLATSENRPGDADFGGDVNTGMEPGTDVPDEYDD